jgi:hypothetical protein
MVTALIRPHPLSSRDQETLPFPAGYSIADMARLFWPDAAHANVVAFVGDWCVPRSSWAHVRPKQGAVVRLGLTAFTGGGKSKGIFALVATIALAIVAPYAAAAMGFTGTAASAVAAGITIAGSLAISAIFKPPMIDAGAPSSNPQDAQTYSITGQANSATPYGPMLRIYGRHRIFPRLAAVPFTVAEGPHQFLYMLLDCGYGPLAIDDLQIGDTAILNFRDVLYRIWPRWKAGDPLDYYRNDTTFENFNLTLHTGSPEVRTTAADASGIVLDFLMPKGLVTFDDRGDRTARSVVFAVELREAGSGGAWVPLRTFPVYVSTPASMQISAGLLNAQAPANDSEGGGEDNPTSGGPYFPAGATAFGLTRRAVFPGIGSGTPQPGDILYFASQEKHAILTVVAIAADTWNVTIAAPGLAREYRGDHVQSPLLRSSEWSTQITDDSPAPLIFSMTIDVPPGAYEVRVTRMSGESDSDRTMDELTWTSIRSVADRPPIAVQDEHTIIELKIRASEQLSGVLQDVNCIATSILPVWNGAAWEELPTRNPAWAFADALRGSGAIRPLPDSRVDYADSLKRWADYCDLAVPNGIGGEPEPRVRFDHVVDYGTTTYQLLQSIAAAGRATPAVRDGKHGVIVDEEQTVPVQLFTPRNSWGFNARRNYLNEPDALRVKFIDPDNNWMEGDVVIYAAGKNAQNAATFEDLKLFGVTRYTQATRDGRYLKAQALLRREEFNVNCDIENLIAARGDLVLVAHDVLEVGGESARIVAVAGNVIQLTDPFGTLPAGRYGVRVRLSDGTVTGPIEAVPVGIDAFDLAALPVPAPAPGDLVAWGFLHTETGEYLVKQVAPGDELSAQLTLAEVARDVYRADEGDIPAYQPPAGGRPVAGPGPAVLNLAVEQIDTTIGREPYCDLALTWDAPQLGGYPKYRIYEIADDGVTTQIADTHLTRLELARALRLLDPGVTGTPRTFGVIGIDAIGRQSAPAFVTFAPADPLHVPGDVQYLASNAHDKTTTLTWFAPTDPAVPGNAQVQFYEVRWQPTGVPTWGTAGRVTELVPWNVTTVTVPSRNGAYLVKAVTASQMESAQAAITVIAVEDLVMQDFWSTHRFAPAWDGVFDHTELDALGRLTLTKEPDGSFAPVGVFYLNDRETFSELLQCRVSATLDASGLNSTLFMADWVPLAIAAPIGGARRGDWAASIWIAARSTRPFVMADWLPLEIADPLDPIPPFDEGDWRPLLHGEYTARDLRFAVVLESFVPNVSPRVDQAGVDIDFPERREEHADILVPAAGLAFTFTRPFVFAPSVAVDLQDADPGDFVDRGPADQAGFPLFIRNAAGASKAGVVDVSAFGVGRVF